MINYVNSPALLALHIKHSIKQRDKELLRRLAAITVLGNVPDIWHGINVTNIEPEYRLAVLMLLNAGGAPLSQAKYNFLTGRDVGAEFGIKKLKSEINDLFDDDIPRHKKIFVHGMVSDLVKEAAPYRSRIILGNYELLSGGLDWMKSIIDFDTIRLSFSPDGIHASLIKQTGDTILASPVWWSPEFNTLHISGGELALAMNVVLAAIWRDACVVREKWSTERSRKLYTPRRREPKTKKRKQITVLPRVVHHVRWSTTTERTGITRAAHMVRAFYRRLPFGGEPSDNARKNAEKFGYPPPPTGYTFVKPHVRGSGKPTNETQKIVCRGLQIASITINHIK